MSPDAWKYPVAIVALQQLQLPRGARILHVGQQAGSVFLWADVDPNAPVERREIQVAPTGGMPTAETPRRHIGTVQMRSGLVWHVFERCEP